MTDLSPRFVLGELDLTDYPFGVEFGSDLGNAESVTDILGSLLADGEIESLLRRSNRTITLPILIADTDLAALASAEAALAAECDKQRNTLAVEPGDDMAPPTVFETFAAEAKRSYDDDLERAGFRRWVLTIKALPFARSVAKIVDNAGTPPSSGGTLLYNCESTTGWVSYGGTTPVVDSAIFSEGAGSLRTVAHSSQIAYFPSYTNASCDDKVTGLSLSTGTGGYMTISVRTEWNDDATAYGGTTTRLLNLYMQVGGVWQEVPSPLAVGRDAAGFVRYVWPVGSGLTVTGLRMVVTQFLLGSGSIYGAPHVWYDDVELLPAATSDHQIIKTLTVQGSARTTGSLHIAAPSDSVALGKVLAITAPTSSLPAGFQPDGRRWVTQGTTTTDATTPDGSYFTPDTATYSTAAGKPIFDVPVGMLTAGPYTMVALVKVESSPTVVGVQARLRYGTTDTGPVSAAEVSIPNLTTGWQFVTVGTVYLPPLPMQSADTSAKVRLLFKGAKLSNVYMIPAWQVGGRPVADFTIVDCGTGTVAAGGASSNLWIKSPDTANPQGAWLRGPTSDGANTQSAWPDARRPGIHVFPPGDLTAFLVSTNAQGPTLALEYYAAWLGMAAS